MPLDQISDRVAARAVGCLGSALVAAGGLSAGALPIGYSTVTRRSPDSRRPGSSPACGWAGTIGGNTYVWICLGLLIAVPTARAATYAPAAGR